MPEIERFTPVAFTVYRPEEEIKTIHSENPLIVSYRKRDSRKRYSNIHVGSDGLSREIQRQLRIFYIMYRSSAGFPQSRKFDMIVSPEYCHFEVIRGDEEVFANEILAIITGGK